MSVVVVKSGAEVREGGVVIVGEVEVKVVEETT